MSTMNRRQVLKYGTAAGLGSALLRPRKHAIASETQSKQPEVQNYKRLGRTGLEISDISFGSSSLRAGQENVVRHAFDCGINYFDSAYNYTGGQAETVIGNVIKDKRDKVYLVSKAQTTARWTSERLMEHLEESLGRLKTDYVDVYLNHAVNSVDVVKNEEWHKFIDKAKEQGKLRFSGISGHAGRLSECLEYALDEDIADVILVAYNFGQDPSFLAKLTRDFDRIVRQPKLPELLEKAKKKDVGTVAMKTLHGARLNDMRPFETDEGTFAQAAFRWVLSNPNMDALVVTMRSTDLIDEYLVASGAEEISYYDQRLLQQYANLNSTTQCRQGCSDCDGSCPYSVQIADVLRTRMYATDYKDLQLAKEEYSKIAINGLACLSCSGDPCKHACTYGIDIATLCAPTHRMLG